MEQSGTARRSLLKHIPLLVLVLIILANRWQKTDPDLWGHIRFGQVMLSSGHIVSRDLYSYTAFGSSWRDHEYLTEIIMAVLYNAAGIVGLKIWKLLCIAATILFLVMGLAETSVSCLVQLDMLAVVAAVLAPHVQFRPQIHTYALFAFMLALLAKDNYRDSAPLWIMVPMMALWSNLHGGFIIGLIALMTYTGAVALLDWYTGRGLRRAGRLTVIAAASAGATLLPPYGINAWRAVLTTLCSPMTYRIFADWQPLIIAMQIQWKSNHYGIVRDLLLLGLWIVLILSVWLRPYGGDFPLLLIAAIMSLAAVKSVRNEPLAAIACAAPAARHFGLLLYRDTQSRREMKIPHLMQWMIAGAVFLTISKGMLSSRLPTDMAYPSAAVNFMKQHRLHGNVLAYFCWGEYLIWHLAPDSKVFFDSRYDMVYPSRATQDYLAFYWSLPGADKVLRAYQHDFILFPMGENVYDRMIRTPGWKLIYRDGESALFARIGSRAAQLPEIPVTGDAPSVQYFP